MSPLTRPVQCIKLVTANDDISYSSKLEYQLFLKSSGLKLCYMVIHALLFPNQTYQIRDIVKFQMVFAVSNKKVIKSDTWIRVRYGHPRLCPSTIASDMDDRSEVMQIRSQSLFGSHEF
jgi:hypothetical protein